VQAGPLLIFGEREELKECSMKRIVAIFSLTLFVGCVRMPPQATAPTSCAPACPWPTKAWLTVEEHKKIVRWVETKTFPDNTFDVKLSKDGVVKIAGIRDEYLVPIYEGFRGLLAEEGEKFSKRAFKKALRRGQITCHLAAATWPEEYYRGVSGTECVNDLLLSLPVPRNAEYLLPQIGIISIPPDGESSQSFRSRSFREATARTSPLACSFAERAIRS